MEQLADIVTAAAARPEVAAAVARVYADVAAEIAARRPVCEMSGRCCHFEKYGHRLYVTTLELAAFVHEQRNVAPFRRPAAAGAWDGTGCPFQVGKLCGVHSIRPFGCRMFFCDPTSTLWQNDQYERFHAEIKRLHEQFAVPYRYVEWRGALASLELAEPNGVGGRERLNQQD